MKRMLSTSLGGIVAFSVVASVHAGGAGPLINLEFRPSFQSVNVGSVVSIGIYASSTFATRTLSSYDLIFSWDPTFLQLTGLDNTGAVPMAANAFYNAAATGGINESIPPADGTGMVTGFAIPMPINAPVATTSGILLTTLKFNALALTPSTPLTILSSAGTPTKFSMVVDGEVPNLDVTGSFSNAAVQIVPAPATGACMLLGALALGRRRR